MSIEITEKIRELSSVAEESCIEAFRRIDRICRINQEKVLRAFVGCPVTESSFTGTTGYGYGDKGREDLDRVCAEIFGTQDALIRHSFTCGTNTLGIALFGVLRPGDTMLSATGTPYDTIRPVIGIGKNDGSGSLADWGVKYRETKLRADGTPDLEGLARDIKEYSPSLVYIQRSRGYSLRPSLGVDDIEKIVSVAKNSGVEKVMVDNCYGEFVETREPSAVGADVIVGSLIKNPGGCIARCGGLIAGRRDLIEKISFRATVPGLGREVGATMGTNRELFMGLFNAPQATAHALKTAEFTARLMTLMGFDVTPRPGEVRADIVQCLLLGNRQNLINYCRGIQAASPVDSHLTPEPWDMPGYDDQVVMAAGAFTSGSSAEISCDAPLREPFAAWQQGGINYDSARYAVMNAASMLERGT